MSTIDLIAHATPKATESTSDARDQLCVKTILVLSVGHASMLLYAMLHLRLKAVNPKYETLGRLSVTLEDIKSFRRLESNAPAILNTAGRRASKRQRAH